MFKTSQEGAMNLAENDETKTLEQKPLRVATFRDRAILRDHQVQVATQCIDLSGKGKKKCPWFSRVEIYNPKDPDIWATNKTLTHFHYTGWLIGILIMVLLGWWPSPTWMSMEVIVTIVSKLGYFIYLRDL